jgi:hypothetical protein
MDQEASMSAADQQLSQQDAHERPADAPERTGEVSGIWLDGDVLACACPQCAAPMSIRLWLMVADCWRCGTSIELTEEQQRVAQRLLDQRQQAPSPPPVMPPARPVPRPTPPPARIPVKPLPSVPERAVAGRHRHRARVAELQSQTEVDLLLRGLFRDLPAWIASLVVHLVLLIALAVWLIKQPELKNRPVLLVLSTQTNQLHREGEKPAAAAEDPVEFEKPGEDEKIEDRPEEKPEEAAIEEPVPRPEPPPRFDPAPQLGNLPQPRPTASGTPAPSRVTPALISGRKATARHQLVKQEGGTSATEAAVARGLEWLARHQDKDGSWSLDAFHRAGDCRGRCSHRGMPSDVSATALALLPLLGAGQTHLQGKYKSEVERGLRWLIEHQLPDGDLPSRMANSHMYAHGQATMALCEAYALTRDDWLHKPAQRAVDFIVDAQHGEGGWRYQPQDRGDTSVVGWQLMALRSAQMAYLVVPPATFVKANRFLDDVQTDSAGGRYCYMPGNRDSYVMTAEALLCRQYSGWPHDHPGLVDGSRYLLKQHLPRRNAAVNMYFVYYATQVMHHLGGEAWDDWNYRVRDILVDAQETKGHAAGSWTPRVGHDESGGRLYMTALAICTLEVYYRHLPLYRQAAVEE